MQQQKWPESRHWLSVQHEHGAEMQGTVHAWLNSCCTERAHQRLSKTSRFDRARWKSQQYTTRLPCSVSNSIDRFTENDLIFQVISSKGIHALDELDGNTASHGYRGVPIISPRCIKSRFLPYTEEIVRTAQAWRTERTRWFFTRKRRNFLESWGRCFPNSSENLAFYVYKTSEFSQISTPGLYVLFPLYPQKIDS